MPRILWCLAQTPSALIKALQQDQDQEHIVFHESRVNITYGYKITTFRKVPS